MCFLRYGNVYEQLILNGFIHYGFCYVLLNYWTEKMLLAKESIGMIYVRLCLVKVLETKNAF